MDRNNRVRGPDAQLNLAWWLDGLKTATTVAELLEVVRQFVGAWPPAKIQELPPAYRPRRLESAEDVSSYALVLARAQLKGDHQAPHLHAMAIFFTDAAMRISEALTVPQRAEALRRFVADEEEGS